MNKKLYLPLAILIIGILAVIISSSIRGGGDDAAITLNAKTDKETYAAGETVTLTLSLENTGESPVCLSDNSQGNVSFLSVTRDGQTVEERTSPSKFIESLSILVTASLEEMAPGENLAIVMPSSYDPGLESAALHTSQVDGISAETTYYAIGDPGVYTVELAYAYAGNESEECSKIFEGETNAALVSFTIE